MPHPCHTKRTACAIPTILINLLCHQQLQLSSQLSAIKLLHLPAKATPSPISYPVRCTLTRSSPPLYMHHSRQASFVAGPLRTFAPQPPRRILVHLSPDRNLHIEAVAVTPSRDRMHVPRTTVQAYLPQPNPQRYHKRKNLKEWIGLCEPPSPPKPPASLLPHLPQ